MLFTISNHCLFCHVFLIDCHSWNPAHKSHWQLLRRARPLLRTGILFFVAVDHEPLHQMCCFDSDSDGFHELFSSSLQWPFLEHIQGLGKWRALTNSHHLHLSPEPHLPPAWFVTFLALFSYHLCPCLISASLILAFYPLGHLWWRSFLVSFGTVVLLSWCYLIGRDLAMVYPVTYARDSCIQWCQSLNIDCSGSQSRLA